MQKRRFVLAFAVLCLHQVSKQAMPTVIYIYMASVAILAQPLTMPERVWTFKGGPPRAWESVCRRLLRWDELAAARVRYVAAAVRALKAGGGAGAKLPREVRDKVWPWLGRGYLPLSSRPHPCPPREESWPFVEWPVTGGGRAAVPEGFCPPHGPPPFLKAEW